MEQPQSDNVSTWKILRSRMHYINATMQRGWGNRSGVRVAYERAVEAFSHALELDPTFVEAYFQRGKLYWRELQNHYRAIRDMTRVLELDPERSEALFNRAIAYQHRNDFNEAIDDLENFLRVDPDSTWRESAELQLAGLREIRDARDEFRSP